MVLLLFPVFWASATHIVGSEIYYTCLGNGQYSITLKVYRDCLIGEAPFDSPAYVAVYNANGGLVTNLQMYHNGAVQMPVVINNPCLQAPPNVCVEEAVYNITVSLPFLAGGYHIAYQRCCRNGTIVNLTNPGAQGATSYVHISEAALNSCNSNPRYDAFPPIALCAGDPLVFDHSATDPDGDLIVYSLCAPYLGGSQADPAPNPASAPPYNTVNWGTGFSAAQPMTSAPPLSIDPATGLLSGTPSQIGQYVVGVCAEEYRDGQLLSVNKRDFQFNVVSCQSFVAAVIPAPQAFHDPCTGRSVTFDNLSVNASSFQWDFGTDAQLDVNSTEQFPTYVFPDTGWFEVTLIANPGLTCADTASQQILIYDPVIAQIPPQDGQCADGNAFAFEAQGQFGPGASFLWEFENALPATSTDRDPQSIMFNGEGTFNVRLTVTQAICSDTDETTISTYPRPEAQFAPGPHLGCPPFAVQFEDQSYSATGHQTLWDFGDGGTFNSANATHVFTQSGTFDITLTVWTSAGCIDTVSLTAPADVVVHPLPSGQLTVSPDTQSIFEPFFTFSGSSSNAIACSIDPGDGNTLTASMAGCNFAYTYADTGNYYPVLHVENSFGCTATDTAFLRVYPEFRFWIPNAFTPGRNRLNDGWGPVTLGVKEYQLWVFNRWGQEVFYSEDPTEKWDGTVQNAGNRETVQGVYAYRVRFRSVDGEPFQYHGSVTLVR